MSGKVRTTYVLMLGTWLILAGEVSLTSLALGLVGIGIAVLALGHVFLPEGKSRSVPDLLVRGFAVLRIVPLFLGEALKGAVRVTFRAIQPRRCFRPGLLRVTTTLQNRSAITLLANLVTLSPGTLTLDFDADEHVLYIHCIDVRNIHGEAGRRALVACYEEPLRRIFE